MTDSAPVTDPLPPAPVPARRRPLFEGPRFWIGLILVGLGLAAALSFLPARGDTADSKPDVEAFCDQVDVLASTDLLSLVAGVAAPPIVGVPTTSTTADASSSSTGTALEQLQSFDQELMELERIAPHEVRTDVHEVRLAVDEVLVSLRQVDVASGIPPTSLLFTVSDAQGEIQRSIERMSTYVQDTCGVDIRNPSLLANPFDR